MRKQEFIKNLRARLTDLPRRDMEERLTFYSEMIDDRIEEGLSEEEAVSEIGTVDEIASQITADISFSKKTRENLKQKKILSIWGTVLLALGSPIWLSLMIAAFAVLLSLYASLWAVIVSLWAAFASFISGFLGGVASGVILICQGNALSGSAILGAGIVCAGLSILLFFGCKAATRGTVQLTKACTVSMKHGFIKKEEA